MHQTYDEEIMDLAVSHFTVIDQLQASCSKKKGKKRKSIYIAPLYSV